MSDRDSTGTPTGSLLDVQDNGLVVEGPPFGLEKIYDYEPGGHHPVHLGDVLHQRYKVVHKLGSGGFANVWLCRDLSLSVPTYVAAKIIVAEASTADCPELKVTQLEKLAPGRAASSRLFGIPLDHFNILGPNGTHFAFISPVLGPRVSKLFHIATDMNDRDLGTTLRKIWLQATEAMALLHSIGICHGGMYLLAYTVSALSL